MIAGRIHLAVCLGVPIGLLAAGYGWLAIDHGTLNLWNVVVHESGRYTLEETIFFFGHFLREIPVDLAYALFLATSFASSASSSGNAVHNSRTLTAAFTAITTAAAIAMAALALTVASAQHGLAHALDDLFQFRTRDDLFAYGSHWHFHWLSTIWFGVTAMLFVPFSTAVFSGNAGEPLPIHSVVKWLPWMYVAVLTLLFGLSLAIFTDIRYAGHQAREIITHGPITALLGIGSLNIFSVLLLRRRRLSAIGSASILRIVHDRWIAVVLFFAIPLYLVIITWSGDAMAAGQSEHGLAAMVGGHVFEHVLDYVFVALMTVSIYGCLLLFSSRSDIE
jgi:hypothetical protein